MLELQREYLEFIDDRENPVIAWACWSCNFRFHFIPVEYPQLSLGHVGVATLSIRAICHGCRTVIAWACWSCNAIPQVKLRQASDLRVCSRPLIVQNC